MTNIKTFQGDVFVSGSLTSTSFDASNVNSGTFADARIPNLNGSKITAGTTGSGSLVRAISPSFGSISMSDYIYHAGDTNTLFGFPSASLFKIRVAGSDALAVYGSGTIVHGDPPASRSKFHQSFIGPNYSDSHDNDRMRIMNRESSNNNEYGFQMAVSGTGNSTIQTISFVNSSGTTVPQYNLQIQPHGGWVGVGTLVPSAPLTVVSTRNADTWSHTNTSLDILYGDKNGNSTYGMSLAVSASRGDGIIQTFNKNSGGAEYDLCLQPSGGRVGVGTVGPGAPLAVYANSGIGTKTAQFVSLDTTASRYAAYISVVNPGNNDAMFGSDGNGFMSNAPTSAAIFNGGPGRIGYQTNGSIRAELNASGRFNAQSFGIWSDERIKDKITDVDDAESLEIIKQLQPRNYVMRENRDEKKWGFIAQEVEQVVPEVVNSIGMGTVHINKKYAITEYNPPVKLADIVYSNVSIADYATLDANVQVYYLGPDSSNTYYSNIVTEAIYSKSNVSALITDEVFDVGNCVKLSVDETYSLNVCCLNVTSVSNNVYVFQDDCIMTVDDHDLVDMNLTDSIYVKSKLLLDIKSIDFDFFNPTIVSALQQLIRNVDDLKERVTVLENT
jgi:hypothetical protein